MTGIEVLEAQDAEDIPADMMPMWLLIPAARRREALARHRILKDYDKRQRPSLAFARTTADSIGVKVRAFYLILSNWRQAGKTPIALVARTSNKPSRLQKAKISDLRRFCKEALEQQPFETVPDHIKTVKSRWRHGTCPSDATIRIFLDQARAQIAPKPGSLVTHPFNRNQKLEKAPAALGQVLAIDHAEATDIMIGGAPLAVTLVFDLYIGAPIGSAIHTGHPDKNTVIMALEDARARLNQINGAMMSDRPMVIYATSDDPLWNGLGDEIESAGYHPSEHVDPQHKHGVLTQRLLGDRLEDVGLRPARASRTNLRPDPTRHAILSTASARIVIDAAIEKHLSPRLPEGTGYNPPVDAVNEGSEASSNHADDFRQAGIGHTQWHSERSPELFARHLSNLAAEAAGKHLRELVIHYPKPSRPHWEIMVRVDREKVKGTTWARLAREAMAILAYEGTLVQITVVV